MTTYTCKDKPSDNISAHPLEAYEAVGLDVEADNGEVEVFLILTPAHAEAFAQDILEAAKAARLAKPSA